MIKAFSPHRKQKKFARDGEIYSWINSLAGNLFAIQMYNAQNIHPGWMLLADNYMDILLYQACQIGLSVQNL